MTKWKRINAQYILTEEGLAAYSNSDYFIFQNIDTKFYRITIHSDPEEDSNIVSDYLNESDVIKFFEEEFEEQSED